MSHTEFSVMLHYHMDEYLTAPTTAFLSVTTNAVKTRRYSARTIEATDGTQ